MTQNLGDQKEQKDQKDSKKKEVGSEKAKADEAAAFDQDAHNTHRRYLDLLRNDFMDRYAAANTETKSPLDYDNIRTLGSGAFATVFLVRDKDSMEIYAMKAIEKRLIVEKKLIKQLTAERKIMSSVQFPFVLNSCAACKDNVYVYFVLPFIGGGELFTIIRKFGVLDEKCAQFYAAQIVLGLEYLHHCCVIHRDIKPENIFIDKTGYAKIGDYGFAKMIQKKNRTWTLCGTPEYIAPEIIACKGYSYSIDWWALGILIFEMLSGYPPFYHPDPVKLYEKIMSGYYKAPPTMTPAGKSIVKHLLLVDPAKRFGSLKSGVFDIKVHKWFEDLDWMEVLHQKMKPPYVPSTKNYGEGEGFLAESKEVKLKRASKCQFADEFQNF